VEKRKAKTKASEPTGLTAQLKQIPRGLSAPFAHSNGSHSDSLFLWEMDAKGRYTQVGPAIKSILGVTPKAAEGRPFYGFFPQDSRGALKDRAMRIFQEKGAFVAFQHAAVHRDGRTVILEMTGLPILSDDGALLGYVGGTRDVTQAIEAQRDLAESEARYRSLVENLNDVLFILTPEGRFSYLNPRFEQLTGYGAANWLGRPFHELVAPEYVDATLELFQAGPSGDDSPGYEIEIIDRSGARVPVEIRVSSLRDPDGREISRIGTARDTRERRTAQQAIVEAKDRMERVLDTMGEGLVVMDADHRISHVNRKACELFQYEPQGLIGQGYPFWCDPGFLPVLERELRRRENGEKSTYEALYRRKDGSPFWARVTAVPVFDEERRFAGSIGVLSDITEERRAAEEIERLHQLNEKLIEIIGAWINVTDTQGRILLWNREAERISGYSREEVLGRDTVWTWLYPDADYRERIWQRQKRMRSGNSASRNTETTIRTKSGRERIIAWRGTPLLDGETVTAWVVVGTDITQQRHDQERLQAYAEAMSELSQEKDRFLSTISHELRTPLTIIRGFVDLLTQEESPQSNWRDRLERIKAQSERLDAFLTDVLRLCRVEPDKDRRRPQVFDLSSMIDAAIGALRPQLEEKEHRLVFEPRRVEVDADPEAAQQVLLNLLTNAIAYTPRGGRIQIVVHELPNRIQVDISDTGIGIAPGEQEAVFNEFYRSNAAKQLKADGTGLGLSIAQRLITGMNGAMWLQRSEPGAGSTFSFTLPTPHPRPPDAAPTGEASTPQ
jgi:PAS domain S-box-containing protein